MKTIKEKGMVEPTCPKCGYKAVRAKKRTLTSWCLICGYEGNTDEFNLKKD